MQANLAGVQNFEHALFIPGTTAGALCIAYTTLIKGCVPVALGYALTRQVRASHVEIHLGVPVKVRDGHIKASHLEIHLRVPVRVKDDHDVCSVQVDAQASSTGRQQEDKLLTALCIEAIDLGLTVLTRCVTCSLSQHQVSSGIPPLTALIVRL